MKSSKQKNKKKTSRPQGRAAINRGSTGKRKISLSGKVKKRTSGLKNSRDAKSCVSTLSSKSGKNSNTKKKKLNSTMSKSATNQKRTENSIVGAGFVRPNDTTGSQRKSALGRGLGALLSNKPVSVSPYPTAMGQTFLSGKGMPFADIHKTAVVAEESKEVREAVSYDQLGTYAGNLAVQEVSVQAEPELLLQPEKSIEAESSAGIYIVQKNESAGEEKQPETDDLSAVASAKAEAQPAHGATITDTLMEAEGLRYLSPDVIIPNPKQPRQYFAESDIQSLAKSIKDSGLLQPILVRSSGTDEDGIKHFEIVAGERRFRAAKLAGLSVIPAIVRELNDLETLELSIVENVQRSDLNPIEEAMAFQRLITEFGQTQQEIAEVLGKDRVAIANSLRLLKLCDAAQNLLIEKQITAGHGKALLMLEDKDRQRTLAERIVPEGLSVRQVEQIAGGKEPAERKVRGKKTGGMVTAVPAKSFAAIELEDRLRRRLGTKVSLQVFAGGEGEIKISFFSKEELLRILEIIEG